MTFSASTPGFFNGLTLFSNPFGDELTYSLAGDALTVNFLGPNLTTTDTAVFTYDGDVSLPTPTPLPAAFPLLRHRLWRDGLPCQAQEAEERSCAGSRLIKAANLIRRDRREAVLLFVRCCSG